MIVYRAGIYLFMAGIGISIALAQSSLFLLMLLPFLFLLARKEAGLTNSVIFWAMGVYILSNILSTIFGINRTVAFSELRKVSLFVIPVTVASYLLTVKAGRLGDTIRTLFIVTVAVVTLNALYGVAEFFFKISEYARTSGLIGGSFHFAMTFAGVLMVIFIFGFGMLFSGIESRTGLLSLAFALLIILSAIILVRERNVWIGTTAGIIIFSLFTSRRMTIAVIGILLIVVFASPAYYRNKIRSIVEPHATESNRMRIALWKSGFRVFAMHPVFGIGRGNYKNISDSTLGNDAERALREKLSPDSPFGHTHNNFIQQLLEHGLVGFLSFVFLFSSTLWITFRNIQYFKSRGERSLFAIGAATFSAISGFLIAGLFEFNFGTSYVIMPVLAYMGFMIALDTRRKELLRGT